MVIANFPWSLKLLYGLIADNVAICKSRKKAFLYIGAMFEIIALLTLFFGKFNAQNALIVAILAFFVNLSQAFMDLIVDTILIDQARNNPETGSEDLRSMASFFQCSGLVIGSIVGGFMNQYYEPKWCFLCYTSVGLFVCAAAVNLSKEIDQKGLN